MAGACENSNNQPTIDMKKALLTLAAVAGLVASAQAQLTLVAAWDFQTTATGGTAAAAAPGSPLVYAANFGSGTLYLNGTNGSSTWTSLASSPQVTGFGGSAINTSFDGSPLLSTVTTGAASLALANSTSNGQSIVFTLDMTGFEGLNITYSTQATASGFDLQTWSYSTNGTTWTNFWTFNPRPTGASTFAAIGVVSLPEITALDGISTAYIKVTFTGATSGSGNNRLDNFQFAATPVPEPHEYAVAMAGLLLAVVVMRRRAHRA